MEEVASDFHAAGCRGVAAENVLYDGEPRRSLGALRAYALPSLLLLQDDVLYVLSDQAMDDNLRCF